MKMQVLKLSHNGIYTVIHDDTQQIDAYRVIRKQNGKQKTIAKYSDLASCLFFLYDIVARS